MKRRTLNVAVLLILMPALQIASAAQQSRQGAGNGILVSKSHMPKLYLMKNGTARELPLEKTQLATTKNKPSSMNSLAADSAVTQAMQAGINTASWDASTHMNSAVGGSAVQQAGGIFSGALSHRTPSVTYVWGVPNPVSTNVLQTVSPTFVVDFSRVIGVKADDYSPTIVKL